ncbi:hypothetical protein K469DRAFT_201407 [Zopfia rhizophila CBS 207.26]|uniref:Uncharacterized protein n=1 Tax=Zopfia rhizophila CBS 207.26 TaxID=1314779 RepID=A0A6A6E0X7_9PEZI|nr:hypothetical protein K469DRAFT_201407 [Zopfia rhizophila CBS 207.26]
MFDLPSVKRVRRNELQSPQSSPRSSPDPTFTEVLRSHVQDEFDFTATYTTNEAVIDEEKEEIELRLFSVPTSSAPQSHKIRLASPETGNGEPGFIMPNRPRNYYFTDGVDSGKEAELQAVAVDGETVMKWAQEPWPGCVLPWKVRTVSSAGLKKVVLVGHSQKLVEANETGVKKRKRKGKKSRIALRKKIQASKTKDDEKARLEREKEEAEREKRARRNREKKVKKRARDKAKKLEGQATTNEWDTGGEGLRMG